MRGIFTRQMSLRTRCPDLSDPSPSCQSGTIVYLFRLRGFNIGQRNRSKRILMQPRFQKILHRYQTGHQTHDKDNSNQSFSRKVISVFVYTISFMIHDFKGFEPSSRNQFYLHFCGVILHSNNPQISADCLILRTSFQYKVLQ